MAVVVDTDALAPRERPEAVMAVFGANEVPQRVEFAATPSLNSSKCGSRPLGSQMPRKAAGSPGLTLGSACSRLLVQMNEN
jgi:hypothetical protein